jgi:transcriptional regulator with XRE-family HTH domain
MGNKYNYPGNDEMGKAEKSREKLPKEIGEKIKTLAVLHGISVNELTKKLSMPTTRISNMLAGRMPGVDILVPIADYFGVSVDYLLGHEKKDPAYTEILTELELLFDKLGVKDIKPNEVEAFTKYMEAQITTYKNIKQMLTDEINKNAEQK